ncbi:glycosyl hydrolase family 65 protein [Lapidilactobacillus dextrinicus]|uniref:glycosyl hydrolase family 65 protein n=1 Tax=Lapidilactobacillus dextrinicus TaxID=51664 RepID=UPI0022E2655B|nr:glycosyl hydrolase family 65 protein [Lapidilactobacillus dextrinicus]
MSEWQIIDNKFEQAQIISNGNKFMTGNGYLGYRGTLDEFEATDFVAVNLLGIYDKHGNKWREPINAFNPFLTTATVDGQSLDVRQLKPITHQQVLDIKYGVHSRKTVFQLADSQATIESERFVSADNDHLLVQKYRVMVTNSQILTVTSAIDKHIWDINGPHLYDLLTTYSDPNQASILATTGEGDQVAVKTFVKTTLKTPKIIDDDDKLALSWTVNAQAGQYYELTKFAWIETSNDADFEPKSKLNIEKLGDYQIQKQRHQKIWQRRWFDADIQIEGDAKAQQALRYSIYHLQIIAPHQLDMSIPARGLSGQTYKGAVFWDTEMFMLPFFLVNEPKVARRLINYRIRTLPMAQKKAQEYGYDGAFYAWESQELGQDGTSDYNVTDVFTKRPMRTYFRDKQIHISADIAYSIWQAYEQTGDVSILRDGGAEVLLECAKFYYSYSYWKPTKRRYEMIDVLGPDEYHERVNNNTYTNIIVKYTANKALEAMAVLNELDAKCAKKIAEKCHFDSYRNKLVDFGEKLYIPQPDSMTSLIPQFDGYFDLENVKVNEVRARLLKDNEYWGGAYGIAADTQVIKQADLIFMFYLFPEAYSKAIKQINWEYYEPRTEHGSSLSSSVYALVACEIGKSEWGYPYFMKSAMVDLTGDSKQFAGDIYIGGTHPAASGGAWLDVVYGFCGLKLSHGELKVTNRLPKHWKSVTFKIIYRGVQYQIFINQTRSSIKKVKKSIDSKAVSS